MSKQKPLEATASQSPVVEPWKPKAPWRHKIVRVFRLERWRILVVFRYYRGLGNPSFEFEFRLGRPPKMKPCDWLIYEDADCGEGGLLRDTASAVATKEVPSPAPASVVGSGEEQTQ